MSFQKELEQLINRYSMENDSNTPDFILATFLAECLDSFNVAVHNREAWYSRNKHLTPHNDKPPNQHT